LNRPSIRILISALVLVLLATLAAAVPLPKVIDRASQLGKMQLDLDRMKEQLRAAGGPSADRRLAARISHMQTSLDAAETGAFIAVRSDKKAAKAKEASVKDDLASAVEAKERAVLESGEERAPKKSLGSKARSVLDGAVAAARQGIDKAGKWVKDNLRLKKLSREDQETEKKGKVVGKAKVMADVLAFLRAEEAEKQLDEADVVEGAKSPTKQKPHVEWSDLPTEGRSLVRTAALAYLSEHDDDGQDGKLAETAVQAEAEEEEEETDVVAAKAEKLAKEKANLDLVGKHVVKTDDSAGKMIPSPDKEDKLDRATEKVQETESATEALNENEPVGETSKIKRIIMSTSDGAVPNGATKEENQLMAEATQY